MTTIIKIAIGDIQQDLMEIERQSGYSDHCYASLLRIVLSPSLYQITDDALTAAIAALRGNQTSNSYLRIMALLNELAPISAS
jgi:hypothetical protein